MVQQLAVATQLLRGSQDRANGLYGRTIVATRLQHGIAILIARQKLTGTEAATGRVRVRTGVFLHKGAKVHHRFPVMRQGASEQILSVGLQVVKKRTGILRTTSTVGGIVVHRWVDMTGQ
jgi:hypothetical protein